MRAIQKQSTLDAVIAAIRDYIVDNHLPVGAVLPTEAELATRLGVSRNILREALRHFRTLGIIATKPKTGAVIAALAPCNPYGNYLPFLVNAREKLLPELAMVRFCLEAGAARFMVVAADAADFATLTALCVDAATATTPERQSALDAAFHGALLHSAHNTILDGMLPLVVDFFTRLRTDLQALPPGAGECRRIQAEHQRILAALTARDAAALTHELEQHIQPYL